MKYFPGTMKILTGIVLSSFLLACGSAPRVHQRDSVEEIISSYSDVSPVAIENALATLQPTALSVLVADTFFINPSSTQLLDMGAYQSPALLVKNTNKNGKIIVSSYVVKPDEGPLYLFYPILTLLDKNGSKLSEVLPTYEFDFSDNVLSNEFVLSRDAEYILIHTSPEFTGMVFSESQGGSIGTGNSSAIAIGAVLGGAIGGAIAGAASNSGGTNNPNDFVFSVGGAIRLESE